MVNIGYNIHPTMTGAKGVGTRQYSAEEKLYLKQTLIDTQPSANLVLAFQKGDDAIEIAELLPQSKVILRFYHDREGDFYNITSPHHLYNAYSPWFKRPNIIINMGNESSSYVSAIELEKQAAFYAEAMELFGKAGIPIAVPGWGTGHPDYDTLALFEPIWKMFDKWPIHGLALHEYFSYRGLEIGNGRIGRHETLVEWLRVKRHRVPDVYITEHGCDEIDGTLRGWKSSYTMDELRYFNFVREARRKSYNRPWIKGIMLYSFGDSNGWPDFDVSQAKEFNKWIADENRIKLIPFYPPVDPPPPPPPIDPPEVPEDMATQQLIEEVRLILAKYEKP